MSGNGKKGLTNATIHSAPAERPIRRTRGRKTAPEPVDPNQTDVKLLNEEEEVVSTLSQPIDALPASASDSRIHLPGMEVDSDEQDDDEPKPKRGRVAKVERSE